MLRFWSYEDQYPERDDEPELWAKTHRADMRLYNAWYFPTVDEVEDFTAALTADTVLQILRGQGVYRGWECRRGTTPEADDPRHSRGLRAKAWLRSKARDEGRHEKELARGRARYRKVKAAQQVKAERRAARLRALQALPLGRQPLWMRQQAVLREAAAIRQAQIDRQAAHEAAWRNVMEIGRRGFLVALSAAPFLQLGPWVGTNLAPTYWSGWKRYQMVVDLAPAGTVPAVYGYWRSLHEDGTIYCWPVVMPAHAPEADLKAAQLAAYDELATELTRRKAPRPDRCFAWMKETPRA